MSSPNTQSARNVRPFVLLLPIGLVAVVALSLMAMQLRDSQFQSQGTSVAANQERPLVFFCAAGVRKPMEQIIADYQAEFGREVELLSGPSGGLLGSIEAKSGTDLSGDLYLAAERQFINLGQRKGLLAEAIPVATQRPVIVVASGNPKAITSVADLLDGSKNITFGIAAERAAIGRVTRETLESQGLWQALKQQRKMESPTVVELVAAVQQGAVDAAISWDATVPQFEGVEAVRAPELEAAGSEIVISVLTRSDRPTEALHFARYVAARDRGLRTMQAHDFETVEGDVWQDHPEVLLFSGSMFQAGVEQAIKRFEQREGATVNRVYDGCGILVGQMRAGAQPEAYLSCDQEFMTMVEDRFGEQTVLSENDIVIAVPKSNPANVNNLQDLLRDEVRVGLCHPTKSALGHLTKKMLSSDHFGNIYDKLMQTKKVETATGVILISQLIGGGLDAVIVYRSNAQSNPDNLIHHLEIVEIDDGDTGLAKAVQPWAIANETDNRRLLERLFETIHSAQTRSEFETAGFRWRYDDSAPSEPTLTN